MGGDAINRQLVEALNASGKIYLTHTTLADRYTIRMSIGQSGTGERHVADAWQAIEEMAVEVEPKV